MADHPSKTAWEKDNVIVARAKINRNQDPELYAYLSSVASIGQATRELMRIGYRHCMETLTKPESE